MRITSGRESPYLLMKEIDSMRDKTNSVLSGFSGRSERDSGLNKIANLYGLSVNSILANYQQGKQCF